MERHPLPRRRVAAADTASPAGSRSSPVDGAGGSRWPISTTQPASQRGRLSQSDAAQLRIVRKLSTFAVLAHSGGQVAPLLAWADLPAWESAQRVASILVMVAFHLLLHAAPRFYLRHSTLLQVALRLAYYAFPLLRKPRGIQAVLNGQPTPGFAGAWLDVLRVAWGSRLVAVLLTALITPLHVLPLVPHLLLQVYSIAMVRNNSSLCAAPLLAHPLTRQRLQHLNRAMDMLLSLLPTGVLLTPGGAANGAQQASTAADGGSGSQQDALAATAQCEGALNFLAALLGLLLPLLFLLKTEPAASIEQLQLRRNRSRCSGMLGRIAAWWHTVEAGAEQALRDLAGRSWLAGELPQPVDPLLGGERWLAWLLLLAMTWVWCAAPMLAAAAHSA